jgi:hypothetical protein
VARLQLLLQADAQLCMIDVDWSNPGTKVIVIWDEPGEPQKEI